MFEFPIDLLIKQNLRSVVFDSTNMGIMSSRAQHFQTKSNSNLSNVLSKDAAFCNLLKSPETIKWLFERPNEYMYKIFENESCKVSLQSAKNESESKVIKHRILYNFIKELRDFRPPQATEWITFHHYMYFIYRHFLSSTPTMSKETLPHVLVKKMYELVISLSYEDKTQFYVRIITLLREYVMTARDNYDNTKGDGVVYLKCLLSYYSSFCSAATKISTVLSEFDQFMNERFHINWYCLHQRMFFQYFFMVATVQSKVSLFNKLIEANLHSNRDLILGYKSFIEDMTVLDRHWELQRRRVTNVSDKSLREESQILQKNWKMFEEITKIMKTNFWIIRSNEHWKLNQETLELDGHFLAIVEDTWHVADRLIATEGNCICEDCLTAEFRQGIFTSTIKHSVGPIERLVMCYICRDVLSLEFLGCHIANEHADLNIPRADVTKSYKWQSTSPSMKKGMPVKRPSMKLCKVLSETMAKTKDTPLFKVNDNSFKIKCENDLSKEVMNKRMLEVPIRTTSEPVVKLYNEKPKKVISSVEESEEPPYNIACNIPHKLPNVNGQVKSAKEPIMKIASEPPIFASNNFSDEMESCRAAFQEFVRNRKEDMSFNKKLDEKKEVMKKPGVDIKKEEKLENPTDHGSGKLSPPNSKSVDNGCVGHACGHKCRKEESQGSSSKKNICPESCDHQKETKKCDCAYCEVFGSNVTTHSHKSSETRDRLRTRLNQRKEKINENLKIKTGATPKTTLSNATSISISKSDVGSKAIPKLIPPSEPKPNLCNCSHNKTSCQNCVPINIKVLGNTLDKSSTSSSIAENTKVTDKGKSTVVTPKNLGDLPDLSDIEGLLEFIQGNKPIDKVAMAQKKAAKKARQKTKKEDEKLKKEAEEEAKKREEERLKEEKRREEELLQAQALARQMKKQKKNKQPKSPIPNESKVKAKNNKAKPQPQATPDTESMEETIPAMVTIKRVVENNNSPPTVTITLKGSTPDQDKLLYTLVNGHASDYTTMGKDKVNNIKKPKSEEQTAKASEANVDIKKKKKKKNANSPVAPSNITVNTVTTKELKVTLAVDKSFHKGKEAFETIKKEKSNNSNNKNKNSKGNDEKRFTTKSSTDCIKDLEIDIPSLKLPPGITITKVNGPVKSKPQPNTPSVTTTATQYPNVPPVSKSGVIVVDTEKLIQQSITANANKKNKKKNRNKKQTQQTNDSNTGGASGIKSDSKPTMVTLKNPIFHTLQTKLVEKTDAQTPYNEQASITKGENGMVTIRRPRCLQLPIEKEPSMNDYITELKPGIGQGKANASGSGNKDKYSSASGKSRNGSSKSGQIENGGRDVPYVTPCNSNSVYTDGAGSFVHSSGSDVSKSGLSAHDILWGLPGIEITKVNKNSVSNDAENRKSCQTADVSIIPTGGSSSNSGEKFNFDRDDWPFESVFAPKDILEDDLDADERELEAFKRFCQQSIPPKHKEKVAHLNVKDIVLKKKNDVTYS